jgi:hypothetical protein
MRNGRRAGSLVDDDVRSSLDLLDGVIGEFDDGLTSSAESEVNHPRHSRSDFKKYQDDEEEVRPDFKSSRLSINNQIDDIFSQLTEEIYEDEKTTNKVEVRQKSPTRNRFDPLPIPPTSKTHPPPIDRKKKPTNRSDNTANYKTQNTLTTDRPRPRQTHADRQNFSLPQKYNRSDGGHGEVILYEDHNDTIRTNERVVVDVHKNGDYVRQHPPPKPEKQKIHLKQSSVERNREAGKNNQQRKRDVTSHEHAVIQELKEKVSDKQGKISKFSNSNKRSQSHQPERDRSEGNSNRRPQRSNYDEGRNSRDGNKRENRRYNSQPATRHMSPNSSVSQRSNPYESVHDSDSTRNVRQPNNSTRPSSKGSGDRRSQTKDQNRENYRRSRSLGPLENRENSLSQQRSRSRGPAQEYVKPGSEEYTPDRPISRHRSQNRGDPPQRTRDNANDRTRSKSRGRRDDEIRERYRDQINNIHTPRSRGPTEEMSRRSRSHGRSPTRRYEYEDSRSKVFPPSPAEAQETIAKMLPRYPQGLPPERQRSMIDLRMSDEVKKNQRRSMAVGPLEDLPPHLRNHLMPSAIKNSINRNQIPSHIDEQLRFQHQMNIEAQREQLLKRGFPVSHPLVSGEIPLHPELLGQLHFEIPSRTTLPLGPEDFRRFLPEMRRNGMQSAFPLGNSEFSQMPVDLNDKSSKVVRQMSKKEQSFVSLPHKDTKKKDKPDNRSRSTDSQENKPKPFSMFQGGQGWMNSGFVKKEGGSDDSKTRQSQHDQQWFMKERDDLKSMPPIIMTDDFDKTRKPSRNDKNRSSFGMILKDKFQKNPNMYFPDTRTPSKSPEFMETRNNKTDSLSDTDTLIHNMSEGSFEKGSTLSGGHSIGSNKSSRSSGKSSAGSHDSINGTPRMIRRTESITTPKEPINTSFLIPTNPSVILNKKTIRNYVPPESTNMLRNFEGNRQGSTPSKGHSKHPEPEQGRERKTNQKNTETNLERKSSMEKLIDDFHRNLPPPAKNNESSIPFSDGDSMFSGSHLDHSLNSLTDKNSKEKAFKIGTVTSQTSHWSVASSVASFDYHSVNSIDKSKRMSKSSNDLQAKRKTHDQLTNLPSLNEDDISPHGVRIPPEGASAESPENSVQRKKGKVVPENNENAGKKINTNISHAQDTVSDLMKSSENDDELLMLRKLISEGRISGLNEKPPPFIPPTPPSKTSSNKKAEGQSPTPPKLSQPRQYTQATKSGDRPRKNREAPKPPVQDFKSPPPTSEIKFISGRRINSVESINDDQSIPSRRSAKREPRSEGVQRSTSMHMPRENSREESTKDAALAQLIADSTEKKFKINSLFKGMWKKKHYSFDLS